MTDLDRRMLLGVASVAGIAAVARAAQAGSLNPPAGPVAPTMKPLDQVEPRTPLQSLSGDNSSQYVINQPGSYYLTGNITGVASLNAIAVSAPHVTIDLNGFALLGTIGSAYGIFGSNAADGLSVRNGAISGWSGGILLATTSSQARIEFVNVDHCSNGGIIIGQRGIISHCTASACGVVGLEAQNGSRVVQCVAAGGTGSGHGISVDYGSVVEGCTCTENAGCGFVMAGAGILVTGCKATFNSMDGVLMNGPYNEVVDTVTTRNTLSGIHSTNSNGRIDRCSMLQNIGNGAQVDTVNGNTLVLRCTAFGNNGGDYSIASGNRPAQVASWGSVAGGFAASDAVANVR